LWICLVCAVSDALLITLGVIGAGEVVERAPAALQVMRWAGAAFLAVYAVLALRRAARPGALLAHATGARGLALGAAIGQTMAFTYLNPHVYLDTMVLLGSIANTHGPALRWAFAGGAATASFVWFFGLGYGARLLAPLFAKAVAWRVFDCVIAGTMLAIAGALALS
jgi:L-lysine exporter family protein LysE/ArgO